ncbi:MAG: hypothetical protein BJ554DRAFT_4108, partial [Olpidium bornovanus]
PPPPPPPNSRLCGQWCSASTASSPRADPREVDRNGNPPVPPDRFAVGAGVRLRHGRRARRPFPAISLLRQKRGGGLVVPVLSRGFLRRRAARLDEKDRRRAPMDEVQVGGGRAVEPADRSRPGRAASDRGRTGCGRGSPLEEQGKDGEDRGHHHQQRPQFVEGQRAAGKPGRKDEQGKARRRRRAATTAL